MKYKQNAFLVRKTQSTHEWYTDTLSPRAPSSDTGYHSPKHQCALHKQHTTYSESIPTMAPASRMNAVMKVWKLSEAAVSRHMIAHLLQ